MALPHQVEETNSGFVIKSLFGFRISELGLQIGFLVLVALALRVVLLLLAGLNAPLVGDEPAYQQIAVNLAAGRGFVQNNNPFFPGQFLYGWQAPLYPLMLGLLYRLLGAHVLLAKLLNIIIGTATVWATFDWARRIFPKDLRYPASGKIPLAAALWVAVYPSLLTNTHLLLSETLFTFLLVLACDLLAAGAVGLSAARGQRRTWFYLLASGGVWGLATLTRGVTLYFVVPLAFWFLVMVRTGADVRLRLRAGLASGLLFALGMAVVIAPWTIRNYTVFKQFVPLETKGGVNFWLGNNPNTPDDFIRNVWKVGVREPMLAALPQDELARDRAGYALGLAYVARAPLTFLRHLPVKFADFWGFERNLVDVAEATREHKPGGWSSPAKIAADLFSAASYVLLILLAIGGFVYAPDDAWKWLLGGFVVYFVSVHLVVFGDARFHVPLVPFLALYAAWLMTAALGRGGRARFAARPRGAAAAALTVVFVGAWLHEILAAIRVLA